MASAVYPLLSEWSQHFMVSTRQNFHERHSYAELQRRNTCSMRKSGIRVSGQTSTATYVQSLWQALLCKFKNTLQCCQRTPSCKQPTHPRMPTPFRELQQKYVQQKSGATTTPPANRMHCREAAPLFTRLLYARAAKLQPHPHLPLTDATLHSSNIPCK